MPNTELDNVLVRVKARLSIADNTKDALLNEIVRGVTDNIAIRVGLVAFPAVLSSIAVDVSVATYNRVGSEGLTSESIDVISSAFIVDLLEAYDAQFSEYKKGLSADEEGLKKKKGLTFW
ncbi:phage head-tail connector protein [Listeria booriae]|uniref:phage head-tail connector protein n=1 Tax=Listeria booriae TaxID=1552123 RepID=UPI00162ACAAA|nr:phage head-tail connector protein [Listeria booriae]MBC2370155.1 phage head-tail connector protein [Listeria booriae]